MKGKKEMVIESQFKKLDIMPMVKYYMDQLGLHELFSRFLPHDRCIIPTPTVLCVMIMNIICAGNPLYKIEEWLTDCTDGFGEQNDVSKHYNDDRCGRSLDRLFDSERGTMMLELAVTAIRIHQLATDAFHNDTTSITFKGRYDISELNAAHICHGHNKDFRPDCKQIVFGLNITGDGHIPLTFNLFDGNQSDDKTHIPNWQALRNLLDKENFIYIADCKLCSIKNLDYIHEHHGLFITIVPENRNMLRPFEQRLKDGQVVWEKAYSVIDTRDKQKTVTYYYHEDEKTESGYRLIWIKSDAKIEQDASRREKRISKTETRLKELSQKLNRRKLKTKEQIEAAILKKIKGCGNYIDVEIHEQPIEVKKKISSGRPGPGSRYETIIQPWYTIEFSRNQKAIDEKAALDGIFPLITNTELSGPDVLRNYKDQPYLEKRFSTTKSVLEIAPMFLEKPSRIEAMVFLYFIALMVISLIERQVRKQMVSDKIEKLPILPQGMNTKKPTWNNIHYHFRNVYLSVIRKNKQVISSQVKGLTELHKTLLRLLRVPEYIYSNLLDGWHDLAVT
jgi:transposase